MADKFLNTGQGAINLTNGTVQIIAAELGAVNLQASKPVKTNAVKQLVSGDLDISDITNLQSELIEKKELSFYEDDSARVNPPAGQLKLYAKTDKRLYKLNDEGDEKQIGNVYSTGTSTNNHLVVWQGGSGDHIQDSGIHYNSVLNALENVEVLQNGLDEIILDSGIQLITSNNINIKGTTDFFSNNITNVNTINGINTGDIILNNGTTPMAATYTPSVAQDVATKDYVDTHSTSGNYLKIDGTSTMAGDLKMADNNIQFTQGVNNSSIEPSAYLEIKDENRVKLSKYTGGANFYEFPLILDPFDPAVFRNYVQFDFQTDFKAELQTTTLKITDENGTMPSLYGWKQMFIQHPNSTVSGWHIGNQYATPTTSDGDLYFSVVLSDGSEKCPAYIQDAFTTPVEMNFTSQHRTYTELKFNDEMVGKLMMATGEYRNMLKLNDEVSTQASIQINDAHPIVVECNEIASKRVFGVCSGIEPEKRTWSSGAFSSIFEKNTADNRIFVNGGGEGSILVIDGQTYENGDLLQSYYCYASKQADDIIRSSTIAKITCDIDFDNIPMEDVRIFKGADSNNNPIFENVLNPDGTIKQQPKYNVKTVELNGQTRKVALVGCIYLMS